MILSYNNPNKFPPYDNQSGAPKQGANTNACGYPQQWDPPHWHGDDKYNPHLRVIINEPDGFRCYYDPVVGTYSFEHPSGHHHAVLADGHVHSVPGHRYEFTGGGHTEAIGGNHDFTTKGHVRKNVTGDHYENIQGSHMKSVGGVTGHIFAGNHTAEHHGNARVRVVGKDSSFGIGVGASDTHDCNFCITPNRIYMRTMEKSSSSGGSGPPDIWIQTGKNHTNIQSGKDFNLQADENISISAKGTKITIQGSTVYVKGTIKHQGDLQVSGNIQAGSVSTPLANITDIKTTTGGQGSGQAPSLNNPAASVLDSGTVT